jgi:hypothetical protein
MCITMMVSRLFSSVAVYGCGGPAERVEDRERIEVIAPVSDLAVDDR